MQPARAPRIELREWDNSDWPLVWYWCRSYWTRIADDYAPQTEREFIKQQMARQAARVGVYRDGELGGIIICEEISPVLGEAHCYFKKSFWGWDTTVPALRASMEIPWALGYEKVHCPILEKNRLMARILLELGGTVEGFFRAQTRQQGQPVDVIVWALFKEV